MTNSYDPAKLGEKDSDGNLTVDAQLAGVRMLLGDTGEGGEWMIGDEEIKYLATVWFAKEGTIEWVASVVADTIANRYAREVGYSADGVSINLGPVAQQYRELAAALRAQHRALLTGGGPDVGGINAGEETDPTLEPFSFGTQMHDNYEAGQQDYAGAYAYYRPEVER